MKAVILAGGFGKRLENLNKSIPKPMTPICEKPVLQHQIETLKKEGISDFVLVVGYLSEKIEKFFGDGSAFGVNISYYREAEPLGTAGALFCLDFKEDFLLCNGDLIFNFDLKKMVDFHKEKNALITLFTHPNSHPFDSTLLCVDEDNRVTSFIPKEKKPYAYSNLCNAGIQIISPEILRLNKHHGKTDFDKDLLYPSIKTNRVFSYKSVEYVKDMGTPERLKETEADILSGVVKSKHSKEAKRAIFLDRDGTVNVHKGYITSPESIELITGVTQAISTFNRLGYLVIIVTNQPVIARGECTQETMKEIHNRMETLLGEEGAFVDEIYYCPHHPDCGFEGEIKALKISCDCRKPQPGMLLKAQKDFNIDLSKSFMIGDSSRDVEAGKNAGCTPILIAEKSDNVSNDVTTFPSLLDFSKELRNK